jgi:multimeric flavodoxin WrbA
MKIVVINGGLHRGCKTDLLLGHFLAKVQHEKGVEAHHHVLCTMRRLEHCQACGACKQHQAVRCMIKDDLTPVLAEVESADVLVMGTPVTGEDPSAYFKIFFNRFYSFLRADGSCRLRPGKKAVLVLTPGASAPDFEKVLEIYAACLEPFGFSELHYVALPPSVDSGAESAALHEAKADVDAVVTQLFV